jgi:hypothetical protein
MGKNNKPTSESLGSRTKRGHGGADAWNPKAGKRDEAGEFDAAKAARDAQRNQARQAGKKP